MSSVLPKLDDGVPVDFGITFWWGDVLSELTDEVA